MAARRKRLRLILIGVLLIPVTLVAFVLARAFWPLEPVALIYSRETTYYTEPLREDGSVDYLAIVEERWGAGVTPENNAAIPLARAFGTDSLAGEDSQAVLERLHPEPLPQQGKYVYWDDYVFDEEVADSRILTQAARSPWTAEEYPQLAEWLKKNAGALALVRSASEKPRLFIPTIAASRPGSLVHVFNTISPFDEATEALRCRAMLRLGEENSVGAWEDLLATWRLGLLMEQQPSLISFLVRDAICLEACRSSTWLVRQGNLNASEARDMVRAWRRSRPARVSRALEFERLVALDFGIAVWTAGPNLAEVDLEEIGSLAQTGPGLDPNVFLRRLNHWHDQLEEVFGARTFSARMEGISAFLERLREHSDEQLERLSSPGGMARFVLSSSRAKRRQVSEFLGDLLPSLMMSSFDSVLRRDAELQARYRLTGTALALAAYRAEHGRYPDELAALERGYLPEIPDDPFTDRPLEYRRRENGYLLYSVGADREDDGGKEGDDDQTSGVDIVVSVGEG